LEGGKAFTWRFKTRDYWQSVPVAQPIDSVEELMLLHQPWVTCQASEVLETIFSYGGRTSLDDEGLVAVDIDEASLEEVNAKLRTLGCTLSNDLLHTVRRSGHE
jgi:hypothetical protein